MPILSTLSWSTGTPNCSELLRCIPCSCAIFGNIKIPRNSLPIVFLNSESDLAIPMLCSETRPSTELRCTFPETVPLGDNLTEFEL